MAPTGESVKKPSRPLQRRFFSFDSIKNLSTTGSHHSHSEPSSTSDGKYGLTSKPSTLHFVDEEKEGTSLSDVPSASNWTASASNWTGQSLNESPQSEEPDFSLIETTNSVTETRKRSSSGPQLRRPVPLSQATALKSAAPDPKVLASPSKSRWEHLRQHVLPSPTGSKTPSFSGGHSQQPSSISIQQSPSTSSFNLSSTPKPSRLARLGFRQVVEHARENIVDGSRKFADDIRRACWTSRYGEQSKGLKADTNTAGSSLHLPFSLPSSTNSSTMMLAHAAQKRTELRRPPSVQSSTQAYRATPSLKYLHQTLLHYASPSGHRPDVQFHLPYENQVLSTLLGPFVASETGIRVDDDRWLAIECFEIAVKTWTVQAEESAVERCIWCCKAATVPSTQRTRVLAALWSVLLHSSFTATTPGTLQTLVQALFSLLQCLTAQPGTDIQAKESKLVRELILQVRSGSCGNLNVLSVEEAYGAIFLVQDEDQNVREALISESLARCLENGTEAGRRWILENLVEEYWPLPPQSASFTPLLGSIHARKIDTFGRASVALLLSEPTNPETMRFFAEAIARVVQTRMLPELQAIEGHGADAGSHIVRIMLEFLCMAGASELTRWASALLCNWYREMPEWKLTIEKTLGRLISNSDWPATLKVLLSVMKVLPEEVRKPLVAFVLPLLSDQVRDDPPAYPCPPLTEVLDGVSRMYPQIFYKPLFTCAASSKEHVVLNVLSLIAALSKFLPDLWTRDAEMISVALMSDVSGSGKGAAAETGRPAWGDARLGQSVLLLELITQIQTIRDGKESPHNLDDQLSIRFYSAFEARIGILLDAKELRLLVPPSQRLLFCLLFLRIRLLTRSLKSSTWLSRVISWFVQDAGVSSDSDVFDEEARSVSQLQTLYLAAHDMSRPSRKSRSTVPFSPILHNVEDAHTSAIVDKRAQLVASLSCGFRAKALELLVALSGLLTSSDYRRVATLLWSKCLDDKDPQVFASASFLAMQCAEKIQVDFIAIIEGDMKSSHATVTLKAIRRINALFNWRFQILSQYVIVDRAHRRPFKLAKGPLPFVATDIGSRLFVREEVTNDLKDKFPLELRKRLSEIGWAQEDKPVDQKLEWINTPMSLLPAYQLERLDGGLDHLPLSPASPDISLVPSPSKGGTSGDGNEPKLLRRKSSASGAHAVKRRAFFAPALAVIFPHLASLIFSSNFAVASAARSAVMDLMRNDPTLLTRPIFDLLAEDQKDMLVAISTLRAFLHVRHLIPPAMAHLVFNNLAGFLKYTARQDETPDALPNFAHTMPILSRLVTHVSDMSIREIRRAKVEPFFVPSGSLWFPSSAPVGSMFPRTLGGEGNPFEAVPLALVAITGIRVSQNMFFLAMLKRHPQAVHMIRKSLSRLVLPSRESRSESSLDVIDFVPHKRDLNQSDYIAPDVVLRGLSLMLSRSYLLLVAQVFRSMSRHLNDRNELALLVDGLNRILLVHGDDIGIISQAMIALMVASTRFRRLFTSGGGYTLFMPAVFKVYAESESHAGIRLAIDYTVNRFYALHQTHFIFQSLDILGHIMMVPDIQTNWIAKNVFTLFASLGKGIPPNTPDAAGIHNSNKVQEREALIVTTAEEKPQTFLASLRQGNQGQSQVTIALPEEYDAGNLGLDDFVRLFLTVIAHDPTILRAEHFLRFFRFIAPHFYKSSGSTRPVLREGIDALGIVLLKAAPSKSKTPDGPLVRAKGNSSIESLSSEAFLENQLQDRSKTPSDIFSMRMDYLSLIVIFIQSGGHFGTAASQRAIELIKLVLRDSGHDHGTRISSFFVDYARASLIRDTPPSIKEVVTFLSDLAPVISAYAIAVDFSGVFDTIAQLAANPLYANEHVFSRIVVTQICTAGLGACELAASENVLLTLPLRPSLVSLMAQAVFLRGADVIAEVEKRRPSFDFLAGVVLPLVMTMKTSAEIVSDGIRTEAWHSEAHARAWVRLLAYAMSACRKRGQSWESPHLHLPGGTKYRDRRNSLTTDNAQTTILVTAMQIVKTIIIRAENDLSARLPGIWSRVASFFKSLLEDGNARFALTLREPSAVPSPIQSPRTSALYSDQTFPSLISTDFRSQSLHIQSLCSPRVIDYTLWSLLELLCLFRSPLLIQMRLFMHEKVVALDQDLRFQQNSFGPSPPRSRRISSSSIFSKPRRRMSDISPDNSPRLGPSVLSPRELTLSIPDVSGRQPGYQYFPSPSGKSPEVRGPKIVHLGPIQNIPLSPLLGSPSPGGTRLLAKSTTVKSLSLVRITYRRIRVVQTWMGYDALLPFPGERHTDDPENMAMWTRKQAMEEVIRETKELMEEFVTAAEDDMVMVDPDQSMTF